MIIESVIWYVSCFVLPSVGECKYLISFLVKGAILLLLAGNPAYGRDFLYPHRRVFLEKKWRQEKPDAVQIYI